MGLPAWGSCRRVLTRIGVPCAMGAPSASSGWSYVGREVEIREAVVNQVLAIWEHLFVTGIIL